MSGIKSNVSGISLVVGGGHIGCYLACAIAKACKQKVSCFVRTNITQVITQLFGSAI